MRSLRLSLCLLLTALAGCVTPLLPDCTRFGRSGQVCPLPPAALPAVDAGHLVSVTHEGKTDTFMGQLHIDDKALRLAASSLFGTGLFILEYDGRKLSVQPDSPQLPGDKLLVMLELALADPSQIRPRLHDLELTVTDTGHGEMREVSEHGRLIVHIERDAAPLAHQTLSISVPPLGLSVSMKPLDETTP